MVNWSANYYRAQHIPSRRRHRPGRAPGTTLPHSHGPKFPAFCHRNETSCSTVISSNATMLGNTERRTDQHGQPWVQTNFQWTENGVHLPSGKTFLIYKNAHCAQRAQTRPKRFRDFTAIICRPTFKTTSILRFYHIYIYFMRVLTP